MNGKKVAVGNQAFLNRVLGGAKTVAIARTDMIQINTCYETGFARGVAENALEPFGEILENLDLGFQFGAKK